MTERPKTLFRQPWRNNVLSEINNVVFPIVHSHMSNILETSCVNQPRQPDFKCIITYEVALNAICNRGVKDGTTFHEYN